MISSIIVDDERANRDLLNNMLKEYCPSVNVIGVAHSADSALSLINRNQPDLLFLDVEMAPKSGFELLREVGDDINFQVVFVTGFGEYAVDAFKFHALDFLLKPIAIDELIDAVARVEAIIAKNEDSKRLQQLLNTMEHPGDSSNQIAIVTKDGSQFIPVRNIILCEAKGSNSIVYTLTETIESTKSLGEYEKLLPHKSLDLNAFWRVHYSYMINIAHIRKINKREHILNMSNGKVVEVAQRRKSEFYQKLKKLGRL